MLTIKLFIMSLLAIVGRPNVGKSTLFNRLVGMRQAIVDETAGVTRDRHYGRCEWCGTEFSVVDTGGYTSNSDDIFEEEIRKQVVLAIEEAHVVLFMVEAGTGITRSTLAELVAIYGQPDSDPFDEYGRDSYQEFGNLNASWTLPDTRIYLSMNQAYTDNGSIDLSYAYRLCYDLSDLDE